MKKYHIIAGAALGIALMAQTTAFAANGTWTHTQETKYGVHTWDNLWFYITDRGTYAKNEWVLDHDIWYWLDADGQLPVYAGVASDGYLYNGLGIYIDFNDASTWALTKELADQIKKGMTYDEVVAILGKEHEVSNSRQVTSSAGNHDYLTLNWYSKDAKGSAYVHLDNGVVTYASSYWN